MYVVAIEVRRTDVVPELGILPVGIESVLFSPSGLGLYNDFTNIGHKFIITDVCTGIGKATWEINRND